MARKRKKSRAKKKNRSESNPSTDVVEEVVSDSPEADARTDGGRSDDGRSPTVDEVVDLDTESADESLDELLAAAAGADLTSGSTSGDLDTDIELGPDEPQWLDVSEDPLPVVDPPLASLDDPSIDEDVVEISLDDVVDDEDPDQLIAEMLAMVDGDQEAEPSDEASTSPSGDEAESTADSAPGGPSTDDEDPMLSGEHPLPPVTDTAPPPRITADALQALRGIQEEGLASILPEELVDLGDPDSPADRDRLLQAALAQAEMQDAIYRVPGPDSGPRSAKPFIVGAVLAVALLLAVSPPGFLTPPAPPVVTPGDRLLGYRVTLLMQAQQVEAFRATSGRLPTSLAEVDQPFPGIQFVLSNNRLYQLVLRTEDRTLIYDSASPDPAFVALADRWVTTREGR